REGSKGVLRTSIVRESRCIRSVRSWGLDTARRGMTSNASRLDAYDQTGETSPSDRSLSAICYWRSNLQGGVACGSGVSGCLANLVRQERMRKMICELA